MNTQTISTPLWSTASFADAPDTSPMEITQLGDHFDRCQGARGRLFKLQCVAESMNGFMAPRFVTTLVVVSMLIGAASLVI